MAQSRGANREGHWQTVRRVLIWTSRKLGYSLLERRYLLNIAPQCLYVITGMETLHPDFEELREAGVEPELEILGRLITFFGPVPPELVAHVDDEGWCNTLVGLSEATAGDPSMRFSQWKEEDFPNLDTETKRVISKMTKLNPAERASMSQVLKDPWWSHHGD